MDRFRVMFEDCRDTSYSMSLCLHSQKTIFTTSDRDNIEQERVKKQHYCFSLRPPFPLLLNIFFVLVQFSIQTI
jgi:hypothetical protein